MILNRKIFPFRDINNLEIWRYNKWQEENRVGIKAKLQDGADRDTRQSEKYVFSALINQR
jgi:hypothetical protein